MATPTYEAIYTTTLASSASEVLMTQIPQGYRDLVLVVETVGSGSNFLYVRFNGDSSSSYSVVRMQGNGSTASSESETATQIRGAFARSYPVISKFEIMDYSATDKHKTVLANPERGEGQDQVTVSASRWANTSAISSISCTNSGTNFAAGSTFSLFGISGVAV